MAIHEARAIRSRVHGLVVMRWAADTRWVRRYFLTVAVLAVVGSMLRNGAAADASASPSPKGDPRGLALLARVQKAYRSVSGVEMTIAALGGKSEFALRSGVVVAAETSIKGLGNTSMVLVRRPGGPTYARLPGRSCWSASDPGVSIEGVGEPFIAYGVVAVQGPRRISGGWSLRVTQAEPGKPVTVGTFFIDVPSYLVRSLTSSLPNGKKLVLRLRTLPSAPRIPKPTPRC
jgi:hypothetical protein